VPPFILWRWKFEILFDPLRHSSPFIGGERWQPRQKGPSLHIRGRGGGLDNLHWCLWCHDVALYVSSLKVWLWDNMTYVPGTLPTIFYFKGWKIQGGSRTQRPVKPHSKMLSPPKPWPIPYRRPKIRRISFRWRVFFSCGLCRPRLHRYRNNGPQQVPSPVLPKPPLTLPLQLSYMPPLISIVNCYVYINFTEIGENNDTAETQLFEDFRRISANSKIHCMYVCNGPASMH
jgi:hypothetical protein